jgi:hypothetical protein
MTKGYRLFLGAILALQGIAPTWGRAQQQIPVAKEPTRTAGDVPGPIKNFGRSVGKLFSGPLHLVISSVAASGGIGGGIGLDIPISDRVGWESKGVYTIRSYWSAESRLEFLGRRSAIEFYGRLRDLPKLPFYGIGNDTEEESRTNFALREGTAGAWATYRLLPFIELGGRAEHVWPEISAGEDTRHPSLDLSDNDALPAVGAQSRYARFQGSVDFMLPPMAGNGFYQGTLARGTYAYYKDLELERYSFRRMDAEVQQKFAGIAASHRLTLHGWASHTQTDPGQEVPFFLQRALGKKGQLKSVHEYLLGSDGTQATLRGYDSFRFMDRDLLLMQAEYRLPVWGPFDATVFYDAGKVASNRQDLNFKNLHDNYGFSLSFMRSHSTAMRFDLGLGGEGPQYILSIFTGEKK